MPHIRVLRDTVCPCCGVHHTVDIQADEYDDLCEECEADWVEACITSGAYNC